MAKSNSSIEFQARAIRRETDLGEAQVTPFAHRYLVRKPRSHQQHLPNHAVFHSGLGGPNGQLENSSGEKRRFELFIDLIWVGIIGNLAGSFSEHAFGSGSGAGVGIAVWHFIILFLMAWRFWSYLQEFMSKYQTNDLIERVFIMWALVLAMMFGNNAPFLFDSKDQSNLALNVYLIWQGSLLVVEAYYSIFIHHIRRRLLLSVLFKLPAVPIWIGADFCSIPVKAGLAFAASTFEYLAHCSFDTPLMERFLREDDRGNRINSDHWVERIQDFYIIVLGEGVLSLIRGSPLGRGLTLQSAGGVCMLITYYVLSGFYFGGDQSRRYIHAVKRTWWRKSLWQFLHNALYGSTLVLGVSAVFLLQHPHSNAIRPREPSSEAAPTTSETLLFLKREEHSPSTEANPETDLSSFIYSAKWTVSGALALAIANQTAIALLHRSLDKPGTLKVSNRYIRLLPRMLLVGVSLGIAADKRLNALTHLGILAGLLMGCLLWEWIASLDHDGGLVEVKGW